MWIIKLGGSWIENPKLKELIISINKFSNKKITLVVGGGCFADSVRHAYRKTKMEEKTANFLALKSTEIFAHYLEEIGENFFLTSNINQFIDGRVKIWLPSFQLRNELSFEKNWDSTSDTVAAWLSFKKPSKGIIFIKSLSLKKKNYNLDELQEKNVLDKNVRKYLQKNIIKKIVGPEVINLINNSSDWDSFVLKLNDINY